MAVIETIGRLPDDPVRLGLFMFLTNINWPTGKDIGVLEFEYQHKQTHPTFTLKDFPFPGSFDVFAANILETDGKGSAAIVNPLSGDMRKFLFLWNKPPRKVGPNVEFICNGTALLFFNLSRMRRELPEGTDDITFKITCPAGANISVPGATQYYVWGNFGDAFPGVEPYTYGSNIMFDSVWGTAAEADARAAILNVHSSYSVHSETGPTQVQSDGLRWTGQFSAYRNKLDFPTNSVPEPAWDVINDPLLTGVAGDGGIHTVTNPLPAVTLKFTIDRANGCISERA